MTQRRGRDAMELNARPAPMRDRVGAPVCHPALAANNSGHQGDSSFLTA
jgi:hypothetical protein